MSNTLHAEFRRGVPQTIREFHIVWRVVTLNRSLRWEGFVEKVDFEPGVK